MSRPLPFTFLTRTPDGETANQLTHGLGLLLSIGGAFFLAQTVRGEEDVWKIAGCDVYGFCLVSLYAASTLSHSFQRPALREFFRMLDQVFIFLMIVGTFTPFAFVHLRQDYWWALLAAMWILALIGIAARVMRRDRTVSILCYMVLGWMPIIAIERIAEIGRFSGLALVLAGGLSYTVGTLFLARDDKHRYFHAVWHLFVIVGSICHFLFLLNCVALWKPGS